MPISSGVVRMQLTPDETERVLAGCQARGIKLSGAITTAGMIAAYSSKELPDYQWEKYDVVTFVDCRTFWTHLLVANSRYALLILCWLLLLTATVLLNCSCSGGYCCRVSLEMLDVVQAVVHHYPPQVGAG